MVYDCKKQLGSVLSAATRNCPWAANVVNTRQLSMSLDGA
jgi:hypothetical protein